MNPCETETRAIAADGESAKEMRERLDYIRGSRKYDPLPDYFAPKYPAAPPKPDWALFAITFVITGGIPTLAVLILLFLVRHG